MSEPHEVAPGVFRFEDGLANWYAIDRDDGIVLVDSGWPRGFAELLDGLRALGRSPADVRALLLTHGHPDHLGGARRLEQEHGVPVYAHPDELERVRGQLPSTRSPTLVLDLWRPSALAFVASSIRRGILSPSWPAEPRPLDPTTLPALVPSLEMVAVPGHTEGHAAYHLRDRGVLFSGDALVTLSVLTGRRGPQLHPRAFQVDAERAVASLPALAAVDAELLLPGHGEPLGGPISAAVERALAPC